VDVAEALRDDTKQSVSYQGLRERLIEAASAFEAEHPKLAGALENVVNALARLNL
jgi:hypothetical protein